MIVAAATAATPHSRHPQPAVVQAAAQTVVVRAVQTVPAVPAVPAVPVLTVTTAVTVTVTATAASRVIT